MGYAECSIIMESRIGSVSSGLGGSSVMRGRTSKNSPFCPQSTSKLTQSIIKDHMVSHYKKVYSAKAAIDASVPKSMIYSVKYNDQIRKDHLRKGGRPHSAHSQRNSRASCSSSEYDDSLFCSSSSLMSSPRLSTSFHAKETVYQSHRPDHFRHSRSTSEIKYRSTEAALHRKQSAYSLGAFGDQSCYKSFQDPVQKTYSGDLLQKHSQHFTPDKPFTPKTLKSEKSSYLEKYRYYRAPRRKPTQDGTNTKRATRSRTKTKGYTQEFDEPSQGFVTEHEWSGDELKDTSFSPSRQQSQVNKSRDHYRFDSPSRASREVGKSPTMMKVSAQEEELKYLEFISTVTEDILSRGHISSRVLGRVMKRHVEMNRHNLDEGKMRHLLGVLRKDLETPTDISTSSAELGKKEHDLFDSLLPHLKSQRSQVKTKEGSDLLSYASLIRYCDTPDYTLSGRTSVCSPYRTASPSRTYDRDEEGDREKHTSSPWLSGHVINYTGIGEDNFPHSQIDITITNGNEDGNENHEYSDEELHQDQAEASYVEQSKELEDLGRSLSRSLHVSSRTSYDNVDTEQHAYRAASVTDDEFF